MNIFFEKANIGDAPKLIEVQNKSFYDDYIEYGECPGYNHSLEHMEGNIKKGRVYKIICDNNIVGDIIVRKLDENNNYYLGGICIIPEYQNLGIGQKAIMHIEKDNANAISWELETPFNRYRNHHFYEKMGYKKISEYRHSDVLVLFRFRKEIFI